MFKKILGIGTLALVGMVVVGLAVGLAFPQEAAAYGGSRGGRDGGWADRTARPAVSNVEQGHIIDDTYEPTEAEVEALLMALDDEYKAWSVYDQVIDDFGNVRPFTNIQRAEEKHIAALVNLFEAYGLKVPENEWAGNVPSYETLSDACAAGVQAEIDNADLYDQLFDMADNPDIVRVFTSLQQASLTKHLPAFERQVR